MKYLTLLALLGLTSSIKLDHSDHLAIQQEADFRPNPVQSPWSAKPKKPDTNKISGGYMPADDGSVFYSREMIDQFSGEADDRLMWSLISKYTIEGNDDGPNGHFYLTLKGATEIGKEVVQTHFGFTGDKRDQFVMARVPQIFAHLDVLGEGYLDASKGTILCRMLVDEPETAFGLQVQMAEDNMETKTAAFRPNAVQSPWAAKAADAPAATLVDGAFKVPDNGAHIPTEYSREMPDRYSAESDDLLMNSLISKYSVEGNAGGSPNGHFFVRKQDGLAVAQEVVGTHLGLTGAKRDAYVNKRYDQLWNHFDVNHDGFLAVARVPPMLRMLVGEVEVNNGLQLQMKSQGPNHHHHQ